MIKPNNSKENKIKNRANVMKMLMLYSPISRIELSKITGLSKMTLTNIINIFMEENLVVETEKDTSTVSGRKPIMLELTNDGMVSVGIYISRKSVHGCVLSVGGNILEHTKQPLNRDENAVSLMNKVYDITQSLIASVSNAKIAGIGVACIGPLDINTGTLLNPPNFYGIKTVPIRDMLEDKFQLPVYIDNDMNVSALAEKYFGLAKEMKDFIYLGVTDGIGSGIIVNNRLLLGDKGFAGEIGHTTIHFEGKICSCGQKGCLEQYADCSAVVKNAQEILQRDNITYKEIAKAMQDGDKQCKALIEKQCQYLSYAIINLINLFDPESIILGHDIAHSGEFVINYLRGQVMGKALVAQRHQTPIFLSKFSDKAPLVGSATLVLDKYFQ